MSAALKAGGRRPLPWIAAILVFLVACALTAVLVWHLEQNRLNERRGEIFQKVEQAAQNLQRQIDRNMALTYTLAALVRHGHGRVGDFETVANELLPYYPGVAALQLAPDGVIQQVVPLAGHEAAIGHDVLNDPARQREALIARDTGHLTLAGPFPLLQGGEGAVARLPVYLDDGDDRIFWGFVAVLMRFPDTLVGAGLARLQEHGIDYELWRIDPKSSRKQVISASAAALSEPVNAVLELAYGNWTLSAAPAPGWGDPFGLALKVVVGLSFSLLMALLAKLLAESRTRERRLAAEVSERTVEILATQGQLQATLEAIPDLMFEIDAEGRICGFHSSRAERLQVPPEDFMGRLLSSFLTAETRPALADGLRLATECGHASGIQYQVPLARGARWYEGSLARKDAGAGQPASFILLARDITHSREAELALRDSREGLQRLLDAMSEGAYGVDTRGNCSFVNRTFLELLGYGDAAEVLGRPIHELIHHSHADGRPYPAAECRMHQAFVAGQSTHVADEVFWHRNGTAIPVEYWSNPVRHDGEVLGAICTFVDITEKLRLGRELDAHRHHLEDLVTQRTTELNAARQLAEAANVAKSAFLANMSHEIRTPLNAILGLAHLVRSAETRPRQMVQLEQIDRAGRHLLGIINDILDLSRIEAGRLDLANTAFQPAAILNSVAAVVEAAAQAKGLRVDVDPGGLPPWLRGDPARLHQALLNYARNAVKFTPRGSIALRAELLHERGADLLVRFEVVDSGIGIAAAKMPQLFHSFTQADASFSRTYGGAGLGLVITRRLAELMGGEVGADSTPGVGSTFWFTARLQHDPGSDHAPAMAADAETRLRQHHTGAHLLLTEADAIDRETLLELLHAAGLDVDTAADGREALKKAAAAVYDLVLMDIQLPDMDGCEAARSIRRLPGWQKVPILALAAAAEDADRLACAAAGINDVIAKPVEPELLYPTLLNRLGEQQLRSSTPPRDDPEPVDVAAADPPRARAVLEQLAPLLASDDTLAGDLFETHRALLRASFGEGALPLQRQIESFDYPAALATLHGLLQTRDQA